MPEYSIKANNTHKSEEWFRKEAYDTLHQKDELRFPIEDYPIFYSWLDIQNNGKGLRLLDIACGQGFFLQAAENGGSELELHGVDFSHVAIEYASNRVSRANLQIGSAYALPFRDGYFDYCVNLGSLEHFDMPKLALEEMYRVVNPKGKVIIIVPNHYYLGTIWKVFAYGEGEDQGQEGMTHFCAISDWISLLSDSKFEILKVRGYNGEDHIAWYFKRKDGKITKREKFWRGLLNTFVKPVIPINLSQCFVFFLRHQP